MTNPEELDLDTPVVVVSADGHVGPRLVEDMRQYCLAEHLEAFDEMAKTLGAQHRASAAATAGRESDGSEAVRHPNAGPGHYDPHVRLAHMDSDGVASEAFYHFSQNGEPFPFTIDPFGPPVPQQWEQAGIGYEMYNRWLADFCSPDPERLLGLVYLPYWDIDRCVEMMTWAREHGLKAINFPPPGRRGIEPYNSLAWEPFWSACEDLGMSLHTHASGAPSGNYMAGPGGARILYFEATGWLARRAVWWLIFGEVFERHPKLRTLQSEQSEGWYVNTMNEMDSMYLTLTRGMGDGDLPRLPSEYMRECVFFGASFVSQAEIQLASHDGWADNLIWGRDYPHAEGTYRYLDDAGAEPYNRRALRHVFSGVPAVDASKMAGANGVAAMGLDGDHLADVARRIEAPTLRELSRPLDEVPELDSFAFVGYGGARAVEPHRREWSDRQAERRRELARH